MLSFKPAFSLSSFTVIQRLFSCSSLPAISMVSTAYLRLLLSVIHNPFQISLVQLGNFFFLHQTYIYSLNTNHTVNRTSNKYYPGQEITLCILETQSSLTTSPNPFYKGSHSPGFSDKHPLGFLLQSSHHECFLSNSFTLHICFCDFILSLNINL